MNNKEHRSVNNPFEPLLGFDDKFGFEVRKRKFIEEKITEQFQLAGYEPIDIPLLEKKEFFTKKYLGSSPWPSFNEKSLFEVDIADYHKNYLKPTKITKGVIIPEGTTSVCRWILRLLCGRIKKIKDLLPLKLYYTINCLRNELGQDLTLSKRREFKHIGLEVFGLKSYLADVEVLYLFTKALESLGVFENEC